MMPDQAALLRKARSSLHAAQLLAGEKLFDFAVSRAYYTMFYVAEALLLGQDLSFSKHSAVLAAFGERLTKPGLVPPQFHKYLLDGEDSRHVGDYDLGPGLSAAEAVEQIRRAQEFLDLAARLIGPLPHQIYYKRLGWPDFAGLSASLLYQVRQLFPAEGITLAAKLTAHLGRVLLRQHSGQLLSAKGDEHPFDGFAGAGAVEGQRSLLKGVIGHPGEQSLQNLFWIVPFAQELCDRRELAESLY